MVHPVENIWSLFKQHIHNIYDKCLWNKGEPEIFDLYVETEILTSSLSAHIYGRVWYFFLDWANIYLFCGREQPWNEWAGKLVREVVVEKLLISWFSGTNRIDIVSRDALYQSNSEMVWALVYISSGSVLGAPKSRKIYILMVVCWDDLFSYTRAYIALPPFTRLWMTWHAPRHPYYGCQMTRCQYVTEWRTHITHGRTVAYLSYTQPMDKARGRVIIWKVSPHMWSSF